MAGEASELHKLATDLGRVSPAVIPNATKAVEVTARHIKDAWNKNLASGAGTSLRHTSRSVDYDMNTGVGGFAAFGGVSRVSVEAEIGPNLGRIQGSMAGWFESGNVDGVPATKPGDAALKANEADFYKGLELAAADALRDAL